ncbi:MAG TPA: hypothetical protein VLX92_14245, partial [Kofleriaceae bacterium]|nr:hypothetical protein [Kofleriaceae bacterium]
AQALRAHTSIPVAIHETQDELPDDTVALVWPARYDDLSSLEPGRRARTIAMDVQRGNELSLLEAHDLAGAVEKHRYFRWQHRREEEAGEGLFVRRGVFSDSDDLELADGAFASEHYAYVKRSGFPSLPALIAAYAERLARDPRTD